MKPHVILVFGPHMPGKERALEEIIKSERPGRIVAESYGTKKENDRCMLEIERKAESLANVQLADHDDENANSLSYHARLFLLAKKHGLDFKFSEEHTIPNMRKMDYYSQSKRRYRCMATNKALEGKLEEAINLKRMEDEEGNRENDIREPIIADRLSELASTPKPVLVSIGSHHTNVIKLLRKKECKVTVYRVSDFGFSGRPTTSSYRVTYKTYDNEGYKKRATWDLFNRIALKHLMSYYGLNIHHSTLIKELIPTLSALRNVPTREIQKFMQRADKYADPASMLYVDDPEIRLVLFLKSKGVKLPSQTEMEKLKKQIQYPLARKVKTLT